jgi:hypothetical protein
VLDILFSLNGSDCRFMLLEIDDLIGNKTNDSGIVNPSALAVLR